MQARRIMILLAASFLVFQGCAGIITFDVPKDLKKSKLVEDPPLSRGPLLGTRPC